MANIKSELLEKLNRALELEHAARIQYLAHAELVKGVNAEKVIERLKEIADDEKKHEDKFRNLIGGYLGGEPTMNLAETHRAQNLPDILKINSKNEKEAIDFYKEIYDLVIRNKDHKDLKYIFVTLEHEIRHIILDEEEHITELDLLLS